MDDRRLEARLRSTLGRLCTRPRAIKIEAEEGFVTVRGAIPEEEFASTLAGLRRVPGVKGLESLLEQDKDASVRLELQVPQRALGTPPDLLQHTLSPGGRTMGGWPPGRCWEPACSAAAFWVRRARSSAA